MLDQPSDPPKPSQSRAAADKKARLAAALRRNLRKRKGWQRAQAALAADQDGESPKRAG